MEINFKLKGYYNFNYDHQSNKIEIEGEINISKDNSIKGKIDYPDTKLKGQTINGYITRGKESIKLSFLKIGLGGSSNSVYELVKKGSKSLEGEYIGKWRRSRSTIEFGPYGEINVQIKSKEECEIEDHAEINLYKKSLIIKAHQKHNNP